MIQYPFTSSLITTQKE